MTLHSEAVLDEWSAEVLYDYARQNDIELTLPQAHALIEANPDAPYGWLVAFCCAKRTLSCDDIGPYLYWNKEDAEADANIYRKDGYRDVSITRAVDHETMRDFLNDLFENNTEAMIL